MGWERKRASSWSSWATSAGTRGILRRAGGRFARLDGVRYVITLDADTLMLRGTALRLIGALAHPLNRATFDDAAAS